MGKRKGKDDVDYEKEEAYKKEGQGDVCVKVWLNNWAESEEGSFDRKKCTTCGQAESNPSSSCFISICSPLYYTYMSTYVGRTVKVGNRKPRTKGA